MEIREVAISRILNPTSIDLGEFVINPYKGCEFACLYCYVRFNKVTLKEKRAWGTYVDVRLNSPLQLERELLAKKPKTVFLGSTTECFQPAEKQYRVTQKLIEILNRNGVYYSILTKSPLIAEYIPLLSKGFCENIYFTINNFSSNLKQFLEPQSPPFSDRIEAIKKLLNHDIHVIPYFSPVLPFITDIHGAFNALNGFKQLDFEGLNFNLGNIRNVINVVGRIYPELKVKYEEMLNDVDFYNSTWGSIKKEIDHYSKTHTIISNIYIHGRREYFSNKYTK